MNSTYALYCDGSSDLKGFGGWGAVLLENGEKVWEGNGPLFECTNNIAELTAALKGLHELVEGSEVVVFSDSQYVVQGITKWITGWLRRDWHTAHNGKVKNREIWKALLKTTLKYNVKFKWVRSHNGDKYNEEADVLAGEGRQEAIAQSIAEKEKHVST